MLVRIKQRNDVNCHLLSYTRTNYLVMIKKKYKKLSWHGCQTEPH